MTTKKTLLGIGLIGTTLLASAFAFDMRGGQQGPGMMNGQGGGIMGGQEMHGNMQEMRGPGFEQFFKEDLTTDQKDGIAQLMKTHQEDMKTLFERYKPAEGEQISDEDKAAFEAEVKSLQDDFFSQLRDYVAADKLDEYDAFVAQQSQNRFMGPRSHQGNGQNQRNGKFGRDPLQNFVDKTSLTDIQKQEIESITKEHKDAVKALIEKYKPENLGDEIDKESLKIEMKTLQTDFFAQMRTYVSEDNLDDYDTFVADALARKNKGPMFGQRGGDMDRPGNGNREMGMQNRKHIINGAALTYVQNKLAPLTADQLNTILDKINTMIDTLSVSDTTDAATQKTLGILNELKGIVQQTISGSDSLDVINQIFE